MSYPKNPYFRLRTQIVTVRSLYIHTLFIFSVCYQEIFQTHSCGDVHLHLFRLRFCKLFGCEQNIKGDKQWILNYFCLCQLTPEAFGITNMFYAAIRKFSTLSKFWIYSLLKSVRFPYFPYFLKSNTLCSHLSLCRTRPPPPFNNALYSPGILSTAWLL